MTEDELLSGLVDAFGYAGVRWRWVHHRRSDLAIVQGSPGLPDILAIGAARDTEGQLLAIECKAEGGTFRPGQIEWLAALRAIPGAVALTVTPATYDGAVSRILGPMLERQYGGRPGMSAGYMPPRSAPAANRAAGSRRRADADRARGRARRW